MGGTLSCLAPPDSPTSNLSKKHPGRAEAIAEYKARKNAGKPKPIPVPQPATITLAEPTPAEPESKPTESDVQPAPEVTDKSLPVDDTVDTKKLDVADDVVEEVNKEIEDTPKVEDVIEPKDVEGVAKDKPEEDTVEVVKEPNEDSKEVSKETPTKVTPETPEEDKIEGDTVTAPKSVEPEPTDIATTGDTKEPEPEPEPVTPVAPTTAPELALPSTEVTIEPGVIASESILKTPTISPLINARRHVFEKGDDTIPEAKELEREVTDPVTGEMVSVEEYRRRTSERMQRRIKEHVDKYESIDEQAMKEMETRKLQEESRSKGREGSVNWTVPEPASPSSPKPSPAKKDAQIFTL